MATAPGGGGPAAATGPGSQAPGISDARAMMAASECRLSGGSSAGPSCDLRPGAPTLPGGGPAHLRGAEHRAFGRRWATPSGQCVGRQCASETRRRHRPVRIGDVSCASWPMSTTPWRDSQLDGRVPTRIALTQSPAVWHHRGVPSRGAQPPSRIAHPEPSEPASRPCPIMTTEPTVSAPTIRRDRQLELYRRALKTCRAARTRTSGRGARTRSTSTAARAAASGTWTATSSSTCGWATGR